MQSLEIKIRRLSLVSARRFDDVVTTLTENIGRPDIRAFHDGVMAASNAADLESLVRSAVGSSDLMEFVRFDAGEILRKERGGAAPKILRLVLGNPIIMSAMARTAPDAAAYAPVTILIDERADGVHLSYDSMESLLTPYGSREALTVARDLDAKIEALLQKAATAE
jgi:hypothetical protein